MEFTKESDSYWWPLEKLSLSLPSDWSKYKFIILDFRSSTPQRIELVLVTDKDTLSKRIHAFQNARTKLAIPIDFYRAPPTKGHDMAATWNQPRRLGFINVEQGGFGPVNVVKEVGLRIKTPINNPVIQIYTISLSVEDPDDKLIETQPLVDEFGQWLLADWAGKIKNLEDLKKAWKLEEKNMKPGNFNYSKYGGYVNSQAKATGFFRVEKIDGRWWFVDPEGHLFLSTGINGMSPGNHTRTFERENIFKVLPPDEFRQPSSPLSPKKTASFSSWNVSRRFDSTYQEQWANMAIKRMDEWGLTTIGTWSDQSLWKLQKKPYVVFMRGWGIEDGVMGLADIYGETYQRRIDSIAGLQCADRKDDPWLLGYFVANEPPWPGRESLLVDKIVEGPETPMKNALKSFLSSGDNPLRRKQFVHQTFEKFLSIVNSAIKKHDPNHLNLGIRFGGTPPDEIIKMAKVFDVYSFNIYTYSIPANYLNKLQQLNDKPILIGEYHFGVPDRGMAPGLSQVADQKQRGIAYQYFTENAYSHPSVVGTYWFTWWDQPATGRNDGENYNIGVVDVTDRPYPDLIKAIKTTNSRLFNIHSGKMAPFNMMPEGRIQYDFSK